MATVRDGSQIVQTPQPLSAFQAGNNATAVVWDAPRGLFIAALSAHGYYSSPDGATWTRLASQPGTGLTTAKCPVGTGGVGSPNCPIFRGALAVQGTTGDLYAMTVDASDNDQGLWQSLCNVGSNGSCSSASPVFANRFDNGAYEVGQGIAGGSTAVSQGTYNLTLAAAPSAGNGTVLFAGTIDLYRCSLSAGASSCTLRNTTNAGNGCNATAAVAPAQHSLATLAQSSGVPMVFFGNDGGLWRSMDGVAETGPVCSSTDASHFDNLNPAIGAGGSLAEVVGFAQDPAVPGTLLAGLGANGSAATANAEALPAWPQMSEGEGGYPQLDPANPADWYIATGAGVNLTLCDLGSACAPANFQQAATVGEPQVDEDAALLDAPTLLDPQATGNLLAATCRVWRGPAASGNTWSLADALSPAMDGSAAPCSLTSALIRSLGAGGPIATGNTAGHNGSEVLYAGMAGVDDGGGSLGGHVFVTTAGNTASKSQRWTDTASGSVVNSSALYNSFGFDISAVVSDLHDATGATVYVTIMGFGQNGEIAHVYGSTDFGAHWTDLSANLPDAPANSLVIDPNDANTVYVALDTGVYTTRAISTCATQNCWSPLGVGLPNAPVTQLLAGADLPTGDGRLGMLRAATYGRGIWQTPLLSAISAEKPNLVASPTSLTFASQPAATESTGQIITLTSSGNAPVTISSLTVTGDFVESDTCSGQTIAVGGTCTVSVRFAPTVTGTRTGLLTIYANIAGGQVTVSLTGTATAPAAVVLTPLLLNFPSTVVNQTAASQIITVSNTGGTPAVLQAAMVTGDFAIQQNTCGTTLASQTGCSVVITFTPTASGTRTGVFTVTDTAGTQTAQLSGIGQAPATDTLAPASLTFAQQMVGTISAPQQITLTNAGDVPLTLISASITSGDFAASNGCSSSLAPHSTCAISVTFVPNRRRNAYRYSHGVRPGPLPDRDSEWNGRCAAGCFTIAIHHQFRWYRRRTRFTHTDHHSDQ
ncbi:MAG: choice-of-anchor D domain-containing protein [Janthinobacterium lividum]